ncbi:MAG: radical SAM protein [Candidatus Hodarchaeota archaeon]
MNNEKPKKTKKFVDPRRVPGEDTRKHAGDLLGLSLNMPAAIAELRRAKAANDIPRFDLDKVELHISDSCNLKCSFCYGKKVVPKKAKRERLTRANVRSVLRDIRDNMPHTEPLMILAGLYSEPLLHREIIPILNDLGSNNFRFGIYTNGLLLNKRNGNKSILNKRIAAAIAENAHKNKQNNLPSYISFNVTATLDKNNLRNTPDKDSLRKEQLKIIGDFVKFKSKSSSPIIINASILALTNKIDYRQIVDELNSAGVDNIRLSFPWLPQTNPMTRAFGGLTRGEFEKRKREFNSLKNEYGEKVSIRLPSGRLHRCFIMALSLSISSEGDIFPCPEVCSLNFKDTHSYGSIHTQDPISTIWGGDKHHAKFLELDPDDVLCECCHVDRELNEVLARYWEDSSLYRNSLEPDPFGVFEWQWAGENWYGKVVLEQETGTNTVTMAKVGRLTKEYNKDGSFYFRMGEVILDLVEGNFQILDNDRIKMMLKVRKLDHNDDVNDEYIEGVLSKTQCFAGDVVYSDSTRSSRRYGGMVIVKHESIKDESVRNWFIS